MSSALPCGMNCARDAEDRGWRAAGSPARFDQGRHGVDEERAGTAVADAVLGGDDEPCAGRHRRAWRRRAATRRGRPRRWRRCPRRRAGRRHSRHAPTILPTPSRQTEPSPARSCRASSPLPTSSRADVAGSASWGSGWSRARGGRGGLQHRRDLLGRRGGEDRHAGDGQGERQVEDAVMARAVVAGDAGPVEHEDDRAAVEAHVEVGLVEGAAEEGRVHGHHRARPAMAMPGGRGDLVLLGDADVEEAVGEPGLEGQEPGRSRHGRGEGDHPGVLLGRRQQRTGEGVGVGGGASWGDRSPSSPRVGAGRGQATAVGPAEPPTASPAELPTVFSSATGLVAFTSCRRWISSSSAGRVAAALLGEHVDDDRAVPLGGVGEGLLHLRRCRGRRSARRSARPGPRRRCGGHHLAQRAGERVHAGVGELAQGGQLRRRSRSRSRARCRWG